MITSSFATGVDRRCSKVLVLRSRVMANAAKRKAGAVGNSPATIRPYLLKAAGLLCIIPLSRIITKVGESVNRNMVLTSLLSSLKTRPATSRELLETMGEIGRAHV